MARVALLLVLVLAACSPATTASTSAPTIADTSTTSEPPDATQTTPAIDLPPCMAGDMPFFEDGSAGVLTEGAGDVATIGGVTWRDYGPCERLIVEYQTVEGAPAVDPPTVATLLIRSSGVLRLTLDSSVTGSRFQEQRLDTDLVSAVFAVENPSRTIFVDIHLANTGVARVFNSSSPARTIIDIRGGGEPIENLPLRSPDLVIVEPLTGDVTYPFSVSGYSLQPDDQISATLQGRGETRETAATIADRYDTWGSFTVLFTDGPDGPITVEIGGLELVLTAR